MRLLVFSESFLPPAYLPRVRYFCTYFSESGWDVDIVSETSDNINYTSLDSSSILNVNYYKYKRGILGKTEWTIKFIINMIWDYKGRYFYKKSIPFTKGKKYDVVFCSSFFTFPLTTAYYYSKKNNTPFFVDLRDIAEQSPDDNHYLAHKPPSFFGDIIVSIYKKSNLKRRNNVLKKATGVTTISPWHVQTLSAYNKHTHLIYNGFDENKFFPVSIQTNRFTISYFGRVYNERMRNPRLLFEALQNLHNKKILTPKNTVVKWYIDDNSKNVIKKISNEYNTDIFNEYFDFIPTDQLNDNTNNSSILLVLTNINSHSNYFGIMTTKFFEAIGVNRPVLCIPDNNDHLSELIKETSCGLVSSSVDEIEDFLLLKFNEWKTKGQTLGLLNDSVRLNFSRQKGAEILERMFLNEINKINNKA